MKWAYLRIEDEFHLADSFNWVVRDELQVDVGEEIRFNMFTVLPTVDFQPPALL